MASTSSRREDTVTVLAITIAIALVLYSIILHEISHGFIAERLGDPTARNAGRLTLNPLKHLDPIGSVILPLVTFFAFGFIIGWALPVPVDPRRFAPRWQRFGFALVGLAGPAINMVIAVLCGTAFRFLGDQHGALGTLLIVIVYLNVLLAIFNLMPLPPFDGSRILAPFMPRAIGRRMDEAGMGTALISLAVVLLLLLPILRHVTMFVASFIVGTDVAAILGR
ncbi:MAG: hypothetical protein A3I44_04850 [Candidatus Sungbacteria bacterium RIFCSPLOWO2_02_FULL_51_17]|uniref:Peptidase M50 domain-containing protein n=1 Tax=Candidatus Sungbacteria bacterium RIFCSPHIGHO2_02_FULL_51_29 TaxID=1802273 RepID=A0A1G2KRP5_9BACT|nr:MAG: hypothetical protein A2676_00130 [Candidatus Sungbacteria bacterium RIFCSPHIGHO2_01_FULL_51_22]OHA01252.1 MAG: hypothetical protein A3C16_02890 [Candidatus Sungbacteria bacterium RIFCSPHIGHO2_02_FULL_51_29]OHA11360.1 MAG: hypothetical protein A3I44_04850 [Candidatus Sungbacteria bacterium RIFCSPLOWO2_02_FULL_51_17]